MKSLTIETIIYELERERKHYALENNRKKDENKYGYLLFLLKKDEN